MAEYIEKAELMKKLCFETAEWYYSPTIKTIKEFPAADVQPVKRGKWVNECIEDDMKVWWAGCSACGEDTHSRYGKVSAYRFCPNCGADMRDVPDTDVPDTDVGEIANVVEFKKRMKQ